MQAENVLNDSVFVRFQIQENAPGLSICAKSAVNSMALGHLDKINGFEFTSKGICSPKKK